jgi:hypothetical protein
MISEFTNLLLNAVFGVCRICGNLPLVSSCARKYTHIMLDAVLMAEKIDPFSVLPAESSPRVHYQIYHFALLDGVFLHANHHSLKQNKLPNGRINRSTPIPIPYTPLKPSSPRCPRPAQGLLLFKLFAVFAGFYSVMVDLLHDMGYLYPVLDVFTHRFLAEWRSRFEDVVVRIERMAGVVTGREERWKHRRGKRDREIVT